MGRYRNPKLVSTQQKQDMAREKEMKRMASNIMSLIFVILIALGIALIVSNLYINAYMKEQEYCSLLALGATYQKIIQIIGCKVAIMLLESIIWTYGISYVIIRYLYSEMYGSLYIMALEYPHILFVSAIGITGVLLFVLLVPLYISYRTKRYIYFTKVE